MSKLSIPAPLRRYLPILEWGHDYNRDTLSNDLVAAVIVMIMLIPQSLAYALLAGLPPEMGLYASILPLMACAVRHQLVARGGAGGGGVADDGGGGWQYGVAGHG